MILFVVDFCDTMKSSNRNGYNESLITLGMSAGTMVIVSFLVAYQRRRARGFSGDNNDDGSDRCNTTGSDGRPSIPVPLLHSPYKEELQLAVQLAHRAGVNMKGYLRAKGTMEEGNFDLGMEIKSNDVDFCTKVDVENELQISKGIRMRFPNHEIIGEEAVGTGVIPKLRTDTPTWIIDPIDGTTNFSQGIFMTCVSIGFCVEGKPVVGVVYAPATEEWYIAASGYGAFRNGIQIQQRNTKTSLSKAVVCCEFGYSRKQHEIDAMLNAVSRILQHGCRAIRQFGSGVLDLCYVATGRIDVVYAGIVNEGWKPWDYAAGLVICQEAGCIMESINQKPGEEFNLYGQSILCGVSREMVDDLRSLLLVPS